MTDFLTEQLQASLKRESELAALIVNYAATIVRYRRLEDMLQQAGKVEGETMNQAAEILAEWRMYEQTFHGAAK